MHAGPGPTGEFRLGMPSKDSIRSQHLTQQAEGYLELGMPQHALDVLQRLGEDNLTSHARYLHGEALRALERWEEAAGWLKPVADQAEGNIHIWLALGWCYKRMGRLDLAIQSIQSALDADPDEAIVHYNLACYESLAGDKPRALRCLAKAIELDPRYRDLVHEESDFDPLRDDPDFQSLTSVIV